MSSPAARTRLAILFYGVLALAAVAWGTARGSANLYLHPDPWFPLATPVSTLWAVVSGLLVAAITVYSTRVLVRRTDWARTLHVEFRALLGPLTNKEILIFAISSGIAEEMLFRGAMQPALGLWLSSAIFGAVHFGPSRAFWPWTLWAGLMGVVFGVLFVATGELIAPVLAHVGINYRNLRFIDRYDPQRSGP